VGWALALGELAIRNSKVDQFLEDPTLTIAAVLLIVVSIGWVIVTRLIVRRYRRAYLRSRRTASAARTRVDVVQPPRDIWSYPP
jgi:hypothetical protein